MDDATPLRDAWSRHNIRRRVLLLAGAGAVASIASLGGTAWQGFAALDRQAVRERERTAAATARALDHLALDDLARITRATGDPRLRDGPEAARTVLHDVLLQAPTLSGVFLLGPDGEVSAAEPAAAGPAGTPVALAARDVLRDGRPRAVATSWPWLIGLVVPCSPPRPAGGLAGIVDLRRGAWAAALTAAAPPGGTGDLVDAAGRTLTGPAEGAAEPSLTAAGELRVDASMAAAPLRVVLRQPSAAAGADLRRWRGRVLVLTPILFLLGVLFAWGAGRSLTAPLAVLTREAERIAAGDLGRAVPDLGEDQAGRLGRAFEAMRRELSRALDALVDSRRDLEVRVAERTAELESLYRALRQRDQSRGHLLGRVISAQEEERKRIARELHDDTCQALAVLGMRLDALRGTCRGAVAGALDEARALAQRTTEGVHRLIFDLRPSVLDDLGLLPAIRWLAARHLDGAGVRVCCEFDDPDVRLAPEAETALFRAAQEAITNVLRHAAATTVYIRAGRKADGLEIEIEDDGSGFEPAEVTRASPSGRGLGLLGIRERLQLLGGGARIESAPGRGTRVVLHAPVALQAAFHA
jgi:signal transduction histidine kinase